MALPSMLIDRRSFRRRLHPKPKRPAARNFPFVQRWPISYPAAAINIGYQFAPAWGARVGVSGWQAKGSWVAPRQDYQYKYLQGNVDIVSDLSTLFCGFNPKRVLNGYVFAGVGLNRGFDNDEAVAIEAVVVQPMKQDIFFALNSAKIQDDQHAKINMLVEYLQKNPSAKVKVTGYADANTGNPRINKTLSEKRASNVADALKAKGITADRMLINSKGDTVQPYNTPEENRVSICIAE